MAFAEKTVTEIVTKLCECRLCNDELKIPIVLPCCHRFCKECLQNLTVERQRDGFFKCPICEVTCPLTETGVDEFMTDFFLENVLNNIRKQMQLTRDQTWRKCGDCSKVKKMYSFCFRCKEPLCQHCRHSHKEHESLIEGESSVINLEDVYPKGFSVEDLLEVSKSPKCPVHTNQMLRLVCLTCKNMPICNECALNDHRSHPTGDLKTSAEGYFTMLKEKMETLHNYGSKLEELREKLESKVSYLEQKATDYLHTSYAENNSMILTERSIAESEVDLKMAQIEAKYEKEMARQAQSMEEEIQKVKDRFEKIFDNLRRTKEAELNDERKMKESKSGKLQKKEEITEYNYQNMQKIVAALAAEEVDKVKAVLEDSKTMLQRYENVMTTANSVLASRNDCEAIRSTPDILVGIDELTPDISKISKLKSFADEPLCKYQLPSVGILAMGLDDDVERVDSIITLRNSNVYGKDIDCITVNSRFDVVIAGHGRNNSHISCMDINGNILNRKLFKNNDSQSISYRYCAPLPGNKMVTICCPDEIGICNLNDWSYRSKHLAKFVNWPNSRNVRCVATDLTQNRIFVGSFNCRDVFVFDENLSYCETITLFPCTQWPYDMCIRWDQLLVCDHSAGKAFAANMKGKQVYKFTAPSHELANWKPRSICADKRGLVYILWQASDWSKAVVVQYRQESDGVMILRRVDKDAACITITETDHETKLLVITKDTGTLFVHS